MNFKIDYAFWLGLFSGFIGWVTSFFMPVTPYIVLVGVLVLMDAYTGVKASKKKGEGFELRRLGVTVEKIILYTILISLSRGMDVVFVSEFTQVAPVAYSVAFGLSAKEFRSNVKNVEVVTGVNVWSRIVDLFQNGVRKSRNQ
jgi:hypothetical protein